jgi:CP family cyanate transporter-like MFS transporter
MISAKTHWPAVVTAVLAGVVGGFAFGKMSPALPLLKDQLGLTLVQAGWLVSAFNGLAAAAAIFFGVFADRVGAFRFCLGGLLCMALGNILGALADGAALLIVSRLVEGLGFLSVIVSAPGLIVAAAAPQQRGVALGMWAAYLPSGVAIVILASPPILSAYGWRAAWVMVAGATLAAALLLWSQRRHYTAVSGARRSLASIRASLAQPVPWLLGLAFAMYAVQHNTLMIWLPTYLLETRGISGMAAAGATAGAVVVNCLGNVLGGYLVQRGVSRGRIIAVTFSATSLLFVAVFSPYLPDTTRYAAAVLYSFITGMVPAAALSAGMRYARSPSEVGAIQGLIVQIGNIGIFLGLPFVATVVTWRASWDATLWVMLGCAAIAFVCAILILRHERREQPAR